MDITLSRTIEGFANYIRLISPDLIIVHGDRAEALAGATVGALNNVLVAHIEGGEVSGTVDELIRHAVTKLSHTHFVANEEAAVRLKQMGESTDSIFVIGSPDIDVMLSAKLPSWNSVKKYYDIPFDDFAISMFHPVTTEFDSMDEYAEEYVSALETAADNYVVIYPNNDKGSDFILQKLKRLTENDHFKVYPSIRFESFLSLMKKAKYIIGNSSAGIREAPIYGLPTVNVGTRQDGRTNNTDIIHTSYTSNDVLQGIYKANTIKLQRKQLFGEGKSDERFIEIIASPDFWHRSKQKRFNDN
jgi:UDP-N-acetylglucosamine 2-epimerase (hydrolysing)